MRRLSLWVLFGLTMFALSLHDVQVSADIGPSESECRPYIEKAINELKTGETTESAEADDNSQDEASVEDTGGEETSKEEAVEGESVEQDVDETEDDDTTEEGVVETVETIEQSEELQSEKDEEDDNEAEGDVEKSEELGQSEEDHETEDQQSEEVTDENKSAEKEEDESKCEEGASCENVDDTKSTEDDDDQKDEESGEDEEKPAKESVEEDKSEEKPTEEQSVEDDEDGDDDEKHEHEDKSEENGTDEDKTEEADDEDEIKSRKRRSLEAEKDDDKEDEDDEDVAEGENEDEDHEEQEQKIEGKEEEEEEEDEDSTANSKEDETKDEASEEQAETEAEADDKEDTEEDDSKEGEEKDADGSKETDADDNDEKDDDDDDKTDDSKEGDEDDEDDDDEEESRPEDDLLLEVEIPENLRDRKHIDELLHLDDEFEEKEKAIDRVAEIILRDLKRIYENAVKPLETLYKYRDLSNRHFSDPEIFSKPLILFMGPWSGGKSTIINYLTENEYTPYSLRAGAEPSPAYFNIVMYGNETEVLDGTQLAADWTFSGLQKFGQGLEDRLRGLKLPNKLLEKVNIVEIPGILEVRKQVSRLFPFNDACQWFIDRADIIFLVYDPAKLDVGPETEAILDQLKGREYQTRIILNKADTVKPEELLRVQSALIWNISPLMSSAQPPIMYTTSLWSHPYEPTSPVRLLQAQERAFLRDIRGSVDKRIENKIASARRFAVRVRNHAKMVDCYLTTYYNHKTLFGNKKRIADQIIENPQNYHIYEGLSTLTNISRYDLPDPEVYRDFFRLNPLYEFKKLSETCTYFRGCPINKLDVAIAYDLPELVGKYKKMSEAALAGLESNDQGKS